MATALGIEAYRRGFGVPILPGLGLVVVLQEKFAAGTLSRFREKLKKMDLLILDEVRYVPFGCDKSG